MARTRDPSLEKERRAQVAQAAMELLAESSWKTVTLQAVARRAGVSKGVVTYWYATKEDLLLASVEHFHQQYALRLLDVAAEELPARERLEKLLELAFPDRETLERELRFQVEVWSFAKETPELQSRLQEAYSEFRGVCAGLIELGVEEKYVTVADRERLEWFVQALLDGVSLNLAFDPGASIEVTRQRLLHYLERWFCPSG